MKDWILILLSTALVGTISLILISLRASYVERRLELLQSQIERLVDQIQEIRDYLGVERVTTPQETKLVKKGKK